MVLAETQKEYGLVTEAQTEDLRAHMEDVDIQRALALEAEIQHDLMADLRVFADQASRGGGIIHLGATSTDVEDNADALRIRQALNLTLVSLRELLRPLGALIDQYADTPLIAFTHLQPAEPSTLGTGWRNMPRTCWKIIAGSMIEGQSSRVKDSRARSERAQATPS